MKKILAVLMVMMLLMSVTVSADSTPSAWAENEIIPQLPQLFESVVGSVDYQRALSRSECCMLIFQVYSKLGGNITPGEVTQKFTDVGAEMSDMFIPFMNKANIVFGISDTEFAPRAHVKRQEFCAMLCRTLEQFDSGVTTDMLSAGGAVAAFADSVNVSDWATNNVGYCLNRGYIKGVSDTEIDPLGDVTVEQAMVICSRIVNEKLGR